MHDDIMHDDDLPVGTILSRRRAVGLIGGSILTAPFMSGLLAGRDSADTGTAEDPPETGDEPLTGTCVARPELTEGPYYVDTNLIRSDIREDREGVPLALTFNVSELSDSTCAPLEGAIVDVWHADALGDYSGVGGTGGETFLRGLQTTDGSGLASFTTIYPGWYQGRAVHIHFKVRSGDGSGAAYEFTSQLFFDDELTSAVYQQSPYNTRGARTTFNIALDV